MVYILHIINYMYSEVFNLNRCLSNQAENKNQHFAYYLFGEFRLRKISHSVSQMMPAEMLRGIYFN